MNESLIHKLRYARNTMLAIACASLIYPMQGTIAARQKQIVPVYDKFGLNKFAPNEFEFIRAMNCKVEQYNFVNEAKDFGNVDGTHSFISKFNDELRKKGFLISKDSHDYLANFEDGDKYSVEIAEDNKERSTWVTLHYRNATKPEPFISGFTMIQPAANEEVGKDFGFEGTDNFFMMGDDGGIDFIVSVGDQGCMVRMPRQLLIRSFMSGADWENHNYAKLQKKVTNVLENVTQKLYKSNNIASLYLSNQLFF
jgi:hypothetical protein